MVEVLGTRSLLGELGDGLSDSLTEMVTREGRGRGGNGAGVEAMVGEVTKGASEGDGGLRGEKEAVLPWLDEIAAAALGVGDDGTAGGEGFDGGNAEGFEAGENESGGGMEVLGELVGGDPRDEGDEGRAGGEGDEAGVFGAVADDGEGEFGLETGGNGEVNAFPGDLAAGDDEAVAGGLGGLGGFCGGLGRLGGFGGLGDGMGGEALEVDGRGDDGGGAVVVATDGSGGVSGDGEELVGTLGGAIVGATERADEKLEKEANEGV